MARDTGSGSGQQGRGVDGRLIVAAVIVIGLVIFIAQNTAETQLSFLFFDFRWPLWLVLTVFAVLAFVIGWLVGRRRTSR